jgi:hypothetical protein
VSEGRPTDFTPELGDLICALICEGYSLRKIAKNDEMPRVSTILDWVMKGTRGDERYEAFSEQYARSLDIRTDNMAEELLEISDDDSLDVGVTEDGKPYVKGEHIQRSRLKVDTRKWLMSKMKPKKYGEKLQQEITMTPHEAALRELE